MSTLRLFDFDVLNGEYEDVDLVIKRLLKSMRFSKLVTLNAEMLVQAVSTADTKRFLKSADLIIPDGFGIVLSGYLLYRKWIQRLTGIGLIEYLFNYSSYKFSGMY